MRKDNKGFSLVELLIAIAISGIVLSALVLLITQSVKSYGRQTALAQIQSDADVSLNQIQKNVMEANEIKLKKTKNGSSIDVECYLDMEQTKTVVDGEEHIETYEWGYYYNSAEKTLYYTDNLHNTEENRSVVCDNVTDFNVLLDSESVTLDSDGITIKNVSIRPQIAVSITISRMGQTRTVKREYITRNQLKSKDGLIQIGKSVAGNVKESELTILDVNKVITAEQVSSYIGN